MVYLQTQGPSKKEINIMFDDIIKTVIIGIGVQVASVFLGKEGAYFSRAFLIISISRIISVMIYHISTWYYEYPYNLNRNK